MMAVIAARLEMTVEAVGGQIELAVFKQGVLDLPRLGVPIEFAALRSAA